MITVLRVMTTTAKRSDEVAYRAVVAYKLGKAALEGVAALVLAIVDAMGAGERLEGLAVALREHVVHWVTHVLADLLAKVMTPRILMLTAAALAVDAVLSGAEGFLLARRYRWAPWVVVISTGLLIPPELVAMFSRPRLGRILLLAINIAVVVILARSARRHTQVKE